MRSVSLLATILAGAAAAAPAAHAIPWDAAGVIPPSRTPPAATPDPLCRQSYANDRPRGGPRMTFGIGPRLAGETGSGQTTPVIREDVRKRDAALLRLRGTRRFAVRLNRLFESDGAAGIARFRAMARHYAALGLDVELQVRYHPAAEQNGDMGAWLAFVRRVVRTFGPIRHVTALQITNEANLELSPNTSDGAYRHAGEALVRGVIAAKRLSVALGHRQLKIGFNFAWRFVDGADAAFWSALGRAGPAFRHATDWVGLDLYPGTYVPAQAGVRNLGDAFLEGVAQMRECYMRKAGFGRSVPLRIEETGYPTGPDRPEETELRAVNAFVRTANAYRGTYGISGFRWFGLRDNNSHGPDFQSYFGLLRDDYRPKPAFAAYRALVARYGAKR